MGPRRIPVLVSFSVLFLLVSFSRISVRFDRKINNRRNNPGSESLEGGETANLSHHPRKSFINSLRVLVALSFLEMEEKKFETSIDNMVREYLSVKTSRSARNPLSRVYVEE